MDVNPVAIILVKCDSKGDRLLYRYPYKLMDTAKISTVEKSFEDFKSLSKSHDWKKRSAYSIATSDDLLQTSYENEYLCTTSKSHMEGFTDEVLSTLFAVKQQLCNQKFELKVNDVRFVSHPTLVQRKDPRMNSVASIQVQSVVPYANSMKPQLQPMQINIVFALYAQASYAIVKCYYELSKRIGLALKVEEQRIGYLTEETMTMARTHDEISNQQLPLERAYELILERCNLAQAFKSMYHDLCTTGLLNTTINQNITLSFCLPQKAHQLHKKGSLVDPEAIDRCLHSLKPYHGMLLLVDFTELLDCVPPSGARMLLQLVEVYTPLMSLQSMASDADFSIEHVYKLVSHLVYWAKATIIYPLCETNVYVIAPDAPLHTKSHLMEKFSTRFGGMSLFEVIADFSLPTSIGHLTTPLQQPARQGILAQMVLWMLQHHLLMQLHTYVQFMPSPEYEPRKENVEKSSSFINCPTMTNFMIENDDDMLSNNSFDGSHDELNAGSLLSLSSQPLPVPHTNRHSIPDDGFSPGNSTMSDNIAAQPSSSHKSNFSITTSISTDNCDSIASIEDEEKIKELLEAFDESDRIAVKRIPAAMNVDDLALMVKLYQAGYFKSEHHLEEIMYFENLRRSQLLQLLDKFRDVLIIYETEDPAIAAIYSNK